MADLSSVGDIAKPIGDLIAGYVPEGPLRTLVIMTSGLCAAIAPFVYKYYLGVLAQGAKPQGSIERQDYDKLRASLAGGNLATRLSAKWLTKFLDWIERFFGDAGMADRTLFPHAFGLKTAAPLWTAAAFDRCMFLALIYPIVTILLIWADSGHVGPAEVACGFTPNLPGWWRGIFAVASLGFLSLVIRCGLRAPGWKSLASIYGAVAIVSAVVVAVFIAVACSVLNAGTAGVTLRTLLRAYADSGVKNFVWGVADSGAIAGAVAIAGAGATAGAGVAAYAVAVPVLNAIATIIAFIAAYASGGATTAVAVVQGDIPIAGAGGAFAVLFTFVYLAVFSGEVVVAGAGAAAVDRLGRKAILHRRQGSFLALSVVAMFLLCMFAANSLSSDTSWGTRGPLLLFLVVLPIMNAPFDWASLGLTRALLRRGLELGGWWPPLLALIDACLAALIIALLALTMVVGVQAFDELAVHGGGEKAAVLPLAPLFEGIAKNPAAPEYWWAYALLLSTMIPSLINLAIAGMAFTRGVPGVSRLLLLWIPEGRDVPDYRRPLAALALTSQMFAGAFLGIAAQAFLAWGLLYHLMPAVGLNLLDMARAVADFDIPTRAGRLVTNFF